MPPPSSSRIVVVDSFAALLAQPLADGVNAVCWPRALAGDFAEVLALLCPADGVVVVEPDDLAALPLTPAGRVAAEAMVADFTALAALGRDPLLNVVVDYDRDERGLPVVADVFSFHVDRAPIETETFLCTYAGAPSEGLANDDATRRIDDPVVRAQLTALYGVDVEQHIVEEQIVEQNFDLHYAMNDGAVPYSFGVFALWRIACQWPGARVPPCIHRAPTTSSPRLLLIC